MKDLIICSVGVHALEMAEIVERINRVAPTWNLLGYFAETTRHDKCVGKELDGHPVLGTIESLPEHPNALLAIANEFGDPFPVERSATLVDPSAFVSRSAQLGRGCVVYPGGFVGHGAVLGNRVFMLSGCTVNHDDTIEDHVIMASRVTLAGKVHVEEGCYLGQGCQVRQFVRISMGSLIGMGAVVLQDVPPNSVMVGNPARRLRDRTTGA